MDNSIYTFHRRFIIVFWMINMFSHNTHLYFFTVNEKTPRNKIIINQIPVAIAQLKVSPKHKQINFMIPQDTSQLMAYIATTTNINIIPVIIYTPLIKF